MIVTKSLKMVYSLLTAASVVALVAFQATLRPVSALDAPRSAPAVQADAAPHALSKNASIRYRLTDFGVLKGGDSRAYAINNSGQIAGSSKGVFFLWQAGVMQELGSLPGERDNQPSAINARGYIVGSAGNPDRDTAILWRNNKMERLFADARGSVALAINDKNQIVGDMAVGSEKPSDAIRHAFLWQEGRITDLGTLSGGNSYARDINVKGQIVGMSDLINDTHGFLWENGKMRDLGTLGGSQADAYGINDSAQVVGSSETKSGESHAY